jgi:hypothetical protein
MSHVVPQMLVNIVVAFRHRRNRVLFAFIALGIVASPVDVLSLFMAKSVSCNDQRLT